MKWKVYNKLCFSFNRENHEQLCGKRNGIADNYLLKGRSREMIGVLTLTECPKAGDQKKNSLLVIIGYSDVFIIVKSGQTFGQSFAIFPVKLCLK